MTTVKPPQPSDRPRQHFRQPLRRAGYALFLGSALSSATLLALTAVPFIAAYVLLLIANCLGSALLLQASADPRHLPQRVRRALRNAVLILCPSVAAGVMAAPLLLELRDSDYAEHATTLLRLLLLSAVPQAVIGLSAAVATIQRRPRVVLVIYAAQAVLVLGGAEIGLRTSGLHGVGIAWVSAQTVLALVLLVTQMRFMLLATLGGPVIAFADSMRRRLRQRRGRAVARRVMPKVFALLDCQWTRWELLTSDSDIVTVASEADGEPVVIKIALSDPAASRTTHHADILNAIAARDDLGTWRELVPAIRQAGTIEGVGFTVETRLPGGTAVSDPRRAEVDRAHIELARAITVLHQATQARVDDEAISRYLDGRLSLFAKLPGNVGRAAGVAALCTLLASELRRDGLCVSWTHGDCWLGNALVSVGATARLTGIIDWENGSEHGLPDVDLAHLWLSSRGQEMGESVRLALAEHPERFDDWLDDIGLVRANRALPAWAVLALAWVEHVSGFVERSSLSAASLTWTSRNVDEVIPTIVCVSQRANAGSGTETGHD